MKGGRFLYSGSPFIRCVHVSIKENIEANCGATGCVKAACHAPKAHLASQLIPFSILKL